MMTDKDILFHPNFTSSKGNQLKCKIKNTWYKADYLGYEGAAEYLCSNILAYTNITNYVFYHLSNMCIPSISNEFKGCSSTNFLKDGEEIITADKLMKYCINPNFPNCYNRLSLKEKIKTFVDDIEKITGIKDFGPKLTQILEFDRFTLNDDRHFNNIAFIRKNDGSFELTPLFDNGGAFLSDIKFDYPLQKNVYGCIASAKAKPFDTDFDKQVEACIELYGSQLQISKEMKIDEKIFQNIENMYGFDIRNHIETILEHQKFMYQEYFKNDIKKQISEKDLSIEMIELT